jgi:ParB family transcriptional regulator, chromosome partitioning protein
VSTSAGQTNAVAPESITPNPKNPRLYFNDERLDQLRTSLQEVGVLVPLIVYEDPSAPGQYVLMDGERRWRSALDLGFDSVPVNVIPPPSSVENLLRMFNIHSVREEWSLIAIALSLRELIGMTGENREGRLAEETGLTRSTVRRAKRLLSLPDSELRLIQEEAHLDRNEQVHREDLYLEVERAASVLRAAIPEIAATYSKPEIVRQFVRKREEGSLNAVTDFRDVGKIAKAATDKLVEEPLLVTAAKRLIDDVSATPPSVYEEVAAQAVEQSELARRIELLTDSLSGYQRRGALTDTLSRQLRRLREQIDRLLGARGSD